MGSNINKLSYFGYSYQIKLICCLLQDKNFLNRIYDILSLDYFDSDAIKWAIELILGHFKEYKSTPSLDVVKVKLSEVSDNVLATSIQDVFKEVAKYKESTDLSFIKDQTIEFCVNQKLKNAISESVSLLEIGEYGSIKKLIDTALHAGVERNVGHVYEDEIVTRLNELARKVIPTPWDVINELTEGGFGPGELIVLCAPPGVGKSMSLVNLAAHAMKQGLNVIYYTLELNEAYVGKRFDSYFTGIPQQNLKYHKEDVQTELGKVPGKLIIKYYPTNNASTNTLDAHISKCKMLGFKPDVIIVDYADLLTDANKNKNSKDYETVGNIYYDLRGLAGLHEVPVFTASQINRSGAELDVIGADKIARSFEKVMVGDFVISLSRKVADKLTGTGRWHIIKNRFGPDGLTFPSKINMAVCKIDIFGEETKEGKDLKGKMKDSVNQERVLIKNRLKELSMGAPQNKSISSELLG